MLWIYPALTLGLIGSLHCAGMCGPIALVLPLGKGNWFRRSLGGLIYNCGRALTYAFLGAVFGLLGKGFSMAGLQRYASITIGILMIISVLLPMVTNIHLSRWTHSLGNFWMTKLQAQLRSSSSISLLAIGLINGFLPCGMVYVAVAGALNTHDVMQGSFFMLTFALGTFPMMLGISVAGHFASLKIRNSIKKTIPYFVFLLGLLFILRGMSLGIPYLSPMDKALAPKTQNIDCCKK